MWKRLRSDDDECLFDPDWPEDGVRDLLVWNPCDGYHIWSRCFPCPPGTHYTTELLAPPSRPCATPA